jgi:hypothetical protein
MGRPGAGRCTGDSLPPELLRRRAVRWSPASLDTPGAAPCGRAGADVLAETPMVAGLMEDHTTHVATEVMVPTPLGGHLDASEVAALVGWLTWRDTGVCWPERPQ